MPRVEGRSSGWRCPRCTLLNNSGVSVCDACLSAYEPEYDNKVGQSFRTSNRSDDSRRREWGCKKCTFINSGLRTVCKMCKEAREGNNSANISETNLNSKALAIQKNCMKLKVRFVDDEFPPALKSLYLNGKESSEKRYGNKLDESKIQWLRPSDIIFKTKTRHHEIKGPWKLAENPSPNDIEQGYLGDCWFMAALTLIADKEVLIDNILVTKSINAVGLYVVRLFQNGVWKDILVDDCFPCVNNQLIYSRTKKKDLWVPLIEKAMAKLHGCYEALTGGSIKEGLTTLTGYCTEKIQLDFDQKDNLLDSELLWAQLLSSYMEGFIMGTTCGQNSKTKGAVISQEECVKMGLQSNHCYSLLEVVVVDGLRFVKLRNPWGKFSWKGDWSEQSPLWTSKLKAQLSLSSEIEGTFWMCYDDFLQYFGDIYICKIRDNWFRTNMGGIILPYIDEDQYPIYSVKVTETTEIDATVYQYYSKNSNLKRDMVHLQIILVEDQKIRNSQRDKTDSYLGKLIGFSENRLKFSVSLNSIVPRGNYFLFLIALNTVNENIFPEYNIELHSSKMIHCEKVAMPNANLVADTLIRIATTTCTPSLLSNDISMYRMSVTHNFDSCVFICENRSKDKVQVSWNVSSQEVDQENENPANGELFYSSRGSDTVTDVILPMQRQVVVICCALRSSVLRYRWKMQTLPRLFEFIPQQKEKHQPRLTPEMENLHSSRSILCRL